MPSRPQVSPRDSIAGRSIADASLKQVTVAYLGVVASGAINRNIFLAPASGARIAGVKLNANVLMYHVASEADTWKFVVRDISRSATLSLNTPSLSGITLAASSWKNLPVNAGNCTLNPHAMLRLELGISGTPQTLANCMVVTEWYPLRVA